MPCLRVYGGAPTPEVGAGARGASLRRLATAPRYGASSTIETAKVERAPFSVTVPWDKKLLMVAHYRRHHRLVTLRSI